MVLGGILVGLVDLVGLVGLGVPPSVPSSSPLQLPITLRIQSSSAMTSAKPAGVMQNWLPKDVTPTTLTFKVLLSTQVNGPVKKHQ